MELIEIQREIERFINEKGLDSTLYVRVIDLVSEVGEMAKEVLKGSEYGKRTFKSNENLESEMGDILFSLICLANITDINLEDSLKKVLNKYEKRFSIKGNIGSE